MNTLSRWTKDHFIALILAFTAGGFLFILAELLLEQHWRGIQLVAPVSAAVGLVLGLLALLGQRGIPVIALFLLLSATGLFGTFQHFEGRTESGEGPSERSQTTLQPVSATFSNQDGYFNENEDAGPPSGFGGSAPPWLAPLSLSGLALLGAVGTLAGKKTV